MLRRSYLAEGVLLLFALLTLGVFDPQLHVVNFNELKLDQAVAGISTADPYNQIKWLGLAGLASLVVLSRPPARLLNACLLAWPLLLLLAYCLLSVAWSDYPEFTVRRAAGLIISAYCLLIALTYIDQPKRAVQIFYLAFWAALFVNLAVLPLPVAFDEFGFFRGAVGNKNSFGSIAAAAVLFGIGIGPWLESGWSKLLRWLFLGAWIGVLILSVSKTSIALVVAVPAVFLLLAAASHVLRIGLGTAGLWILALATTAGVIAYGVLGYSPIDLVLPDTTFNERTPIWAFMAHEIGDNWLLGAGFGAFWGVGYEARNLSSIYSYIQLINQSHNGYIDVVAALGVIGLALLFINLAYAARASETWRARDPILFRFFWLLFIYVLLHNTMESSFLVPFNAVWHLTLFALLIAMLRDAKGGPSWAR